MAERRSAPARPSAQQGVDTTALQVAERLAGMLDGHMTLDTERFDNLKTDVTELKEDVRQLNDDARRAIDEVRKQQDEHHKSNTASLQNLAAGLTDLAQRFAVGQSRHDGERGFVGFLVKVAPVLLSAATLAYLIWGHK